VAGFRYEESSRPPWNHQWANKQWAKKQLANKQSGGVNLPSRVSIFFDNKLN